MSWVVPLVGCGGPAVSRCGHETRRHRVRGALFASVFASVLLAACGGGSGGNLTTSSEREPGPPGPGPLTATGDGDGEKTEEKQEQQKIIVNKEEEIIDVIIEQPEEEESEEEEEQQIIVVNIQPEPEEESEEEKQQQQLTIIEEEDIPYVPPEKEGPRYSAATHTQTQATNGLNIPDGLNIGEAIPDKDRVTTSLKGSFPAGIIGGGAFPYGLEASERFSDNKIRFLTLSTFLSPKYRPGNYTPHKQGATLSYSREDGFKGVYIYEGETGELTGDVELQATFSTGNPTINGNISTDLEIGENDLLGIVLGFGGIDYTTGVGGLDPDLALSGVSFLKFGKTDFTSSQTDLATMHDPGQAKLTMVLSPDGRPGRGSAGGALSQPESYPSLIAGGVEINGFKIKATDRDTNTLVGAFIGDNQEIPPRKIRKSIQGSIGMFSYGIWASEDFPSNTIRFLKETTKFNPERTASDYTAHTYHDTASKNINLRYKRENGFKGVYIYEGETGELTGDVDLAVSFLGYSVIVTGGNILTDLEIGGYDLKGIAMQSGPIDGRGSDNTHNNGVGGIDIDADGIDDRATNARLTFGISDDGIVDKPTIYHHGLARKVRVALSSDGIQAQGSTPETYPSQIAGEVELNGFKIKESDGDNNTILGVFVADKQE